MKLWNSTNTVNMLTIVDNLIIRNKLNTKSVISSKLVHVVFI